MRLGKFMGIAAVLPIGLLFVGAKRRDAAPAADADDLGTTPAERAARVLETLDVKRIRAEAARLRKLGETQWADALEKAIPTVERLARIKKEPKPVWPRTADPVAEDFLLNPRPLTDEDLRIAVWMGAPDNGGPALVPADSTMPQPGSKRRLTPRERWLLAPYFPVTADLDLEIVFGPPPGGDTFVNPLMHAVTASVGSGAPMVFFPNGPQLMLDRFAMCVLGHELIHGAQARIGMRSTDPLESYARWGYELSPHEVQARAFQRVMWFDFAKRAAAYFAARGVR